ncbi:MULTISPECIES: hypothetical protein [Kamptonema]|uniref:hypothetical protein n=1 Tax=Kamptonema TaxID=1501433 RepID=UPI0001DAC806|nr:MULTISPECIES: hypothetical protein [Kamptonema]CBN55511.1 exported hypothetical protein [Kamptonema sp. PCC 6506]
MLTQKSLFFFLSTTLLVTLTSESSSAFSITQNPGLLDYQAYSVFIGEGQGLNTLNAADPLDPSSSDSNTVEVDGIRFKIVMPKRFLTIPSKQSDAKTDVSFGLIITNIQKKHIHLVRFNNPIPVLVGKDNKNIPVVLLRGPIEPSKSDYMLLNPGDSVNFLLEGKLSWIDQNYLELKVTNLSGSTWSFVGLKPDAYKIQLIYSSLIQTQFSQPEIQVLENLWKGQVATPSVEFWLVPQSGKI